MEPNKDSPAFIANARRGFLFEKYVVDHFDPTYFTLLEWRGDKCGDFLKPVSSKNPDLILSYGEGRQNCFAVECKYRSFIEAEFIFKPEHLDNYFLFLEKTMIPVFIVIGLYGKPESPEGEFIVPLDDLAKDRAMPERRLEKYLRSTGRTKFFWDTEQRILK